MLVFPQAIPLKYKDKNTTYNERGVFIMRQTTVSLISLRFMRYFSSTINIIPQGSLRMSLSLAFKP